MKEDYIGKKYNRLTITAIEIKRIKGRNYTYAVCKCDCGKICKPRLDYVIHNRTKSCGCYNRELIIAIDKKRKKHGKTNTAEFSIWSAMIKRCYNKNDISYERYGARNIKVCDRWLDKENGFMNFYKDMGNRPNALYSIDRIDNNGNYESDNCKWSTNIEQQNNKRNNHLLTYNNETHTIAEWSRICGIKPQTIWSRLNRGWTVFETLTNIP